jgi:hypothetical protein
MVLRCSASGATAPDNRSAVLDSQHSERFVAPESRLFWQLTRLVEGQIAVLTSRLFGMYLLVFELSLT